ncbi:ejaculatory bulb-specific protein 3-like isoform X4 [Choristoneura fumiferana]|uniref:ejaculatory bulb-specific protein 3-like isoform X4 n=1 Tax=Choristoneura fumiferana TaxID=7141 RepID=UPI003D1568BF
MKLFLVICLCSVLSVAVLAAETVYTNYDEVNVESMIMDDKKMKVIFDCIFDRAPCGDYQKLKEVIPEALQTTCGKCTPKQKQLIKQVIRGIMEKHPDSWKELIEKFDKDGKYRENFDKFLAEKE